MLSRRDFIGAVIGAAAAATNALALPADKFRWAINTNMFTPLKPNPQAGFNMAARFGFHGVEPWANQMQAYLSQPPEVFKKLLDEAGIVQDADPSLISPGVDDANESIARFVKALGAPRHFERETDPPLI